MSDAVNVVSRLPAGPDVVGYVEAVTETAALGWAWRPGSSERVAVELRDGEVTLAEAQADGMRDDLARSGIGDGRHAFTLPIPDAVRQRRNELRVVVLRDGDKPVVLDAPPPAPATTPMDGDKLQRGVDMLIGSQRMMHRTLQTALLQQGPPLATALADIAAAQTGLQESIATFELFAIRLEQALQAHEAPAAAARPHPGLAVVAAMAGLALLGACWALWRTMQG